MNKLGNKHEGFAYFQSVVATVPPMIADWAWNRFGWNPRIWLRNRNVFTQSQALWCIVGYIIGLGDRHPDNILIDEETGEVVHVDFDCIFSRGMSLQIPELVPFRLTKICVSGMGATGVEGRFRHQCESVLKLLRNKKKTLLAVLHSFIADPLIDWQGSTSDKNGSPTSSFKKAKDVITAIEKKLNGYVDVGEIRPAVPGTADEKLFMYNENAETAKASGLGKDRGAALSVEGQVDELIRAAMCERNLARMYLGWMPLF
jgi:phosphatidylinositol kinase/protein kinase (PI-3  family)